MSGRWAFASDTRRDTGLFDRSVGRRLAIKSLSGKMRDGAAGSGSEGALESGIIESVGVGKKAGSADFCVGAGGDVSGIRERDGGGTAVGG